MGNKRFAKNNTMLQPLLHTVHFDTCSRLQAISICEQLQTHAKIAQVRIVCSFALYCI